MRLLTGQAIADAGELASSGTSCRARRRRRGPRWASSPSSTTSTSTSRSRTTSRSSPASTGSTDVAAAVDRGARARPAHRPAPGRGRRALGRDAPAPAARPRPRPPARGWSLLDEPTVGLDPQIRTELWSLIDGLRAEGTTILMSTHYIEEAERLADEVALMTEGQDHRPRPPGELIAEHAGRETAEVYAPPERLAEVRAEAEAEGLRGAPGRAGDRDRRRRAGQRRRRPRRAPSAAPPRSRTSSCC